jgi:hypothetical protein
MSPPPLLGLGLALAAAAGNNLGKGLQKAATRHLPQLNLGRSEVRMFQNCLNFVCRPLCCVAGAVWSVPQPRSCKQHAAVQKAATRHLPQLNLGRSEVRFGSSCLRGKSSVARAGAAFLQAACISGCA